MPNKPVHTLNEERLKWHEDVNMSQPILYSLKIKQPVNLATMDVLRERVFIINYRNV